MIDIGLAEIMLDRAQTSARKRPELLVTQGVALALALTDH
jgi:hypothetical protein